MKVEKVEGIVLRSQEYQESSRIIAVYTPSAGLIQLIVKKISNPRLMALTTPFTEGEFYYREGKSTLFSFQEGMVLDEHLLLRGALSALKTAGAMTTALLFVLLPESADPLLYALYKAYLSHVPHCKNHPLLLTSFYLKLLNYEGMLVKEELASEGPLVEQLLALRSFKSLEFLTPSISLQEWTEKKTNTFLRDFKTS